MKKKVSKAKAKSNVIQLYPAHKGTRRTKKTQEPVMEIIGVGALHMFDLNFQIGIMPDHNYILGFMCSCEQVHPLEDEASLCRMDSRSYTPAEFLMAMMPFISHVVKTRMFDLDIIRPSDE